MSSQPAMPNQERKTEDLLTPRTVGSRIERVTRVLIPLQSQLLEVRDTFVPARVKMITKIKAASLWEAK